MVAYRTINRFYSQKIYWLLPSYEQEGEAIQTPLEKQNLNRVSYINQQEERFFKPLEFIREDKIKIISSVNIPFNSRFGQDLTSCDDKYYKSRLTLEILKAIRLYGSSIIYMQADICWQSFIFNFATSSRMTGEHFAWILGLESSNFINPNTQKEVQNRSSVHLSILDDGLIALTPLAFIPQNYFDFSMHYIRKLLNFINKMYQDNNHQLDLAFTQQFYQNQLFDDQGQSIAELSVFNMQNKIPIEVFQILHQQVVEKAKILYPGPTYDPPPQKLTIDISYSTNTGGPENESFPTISIPPQQLPCIVDYVNNDWKLFQNYILRGNALSYGGLYFELNYSLTFFKQNFKKIGIAHQAPIMILGWLPNYYVLQAMDIKIPYLFFSREDEFQDVSQFENAFNNYIS